MEYTKDFLKGLTDVGSFPDLKVLSWIDLILWSLGLKLYRSSWIILIINYWMLQYPYQLNYRNGRRNIINYISDPVSLISLVNISLYSFSLTLQINCFIRRRELCKLFNKILKYIKHNPHHLKEIKKFCRKLFCFFTVSLLLLTVSQMLVMFKIPLSRVAKNLYPEVEWKDIKWYHLFRCIIGYARFPHHTCSWFPLVGVLFILFKYLMCIIKSDFLEFIRVTNRKFELTTKKIRRLRRFLITIQKLDGRISKFLKPNLLLWISYTYIAYVCMFTAFSGNLYGEKASLFPKLSEIGIATVPLCVLLTVIWYESHSSNSLIEQLAKIEKIPFIYHHMNKRTKRKFRLLLTDCRRVMYKEFSVYTIFDMNFSLVFQMSYSLIPLAALIFQLQVLEEESCYQITAL